MKHALVTGGAGFIGSHLVDSLLGDGWAVTVFDNFDPFYSAAIKEENVSPHLARRGYRLVNGDVRDLEAMNHAVGRPYDVIVHMAARVGVRASIGDPIGYQDVNVAGTQNLLEFARRWRVPQFVFASSSSVYGVNPNVPWREDDSVLLPISPYASTKVSGELLGHVYSYLYDMRFIALRFFTVFGPRQRPDLAIHKFARLIVERRPIQMFGDGSTRREYTYVEDIVQGVRRAMEYTATPYEVINLGNNHTISLRDMVAGLEQALHMTAIIEQHPEQPGDVPQTWANIDKARRLLGYEPRTSYDVGVGRFVEWMGALRSESRTR